MQIRLAIERLVPPKPNVSKIACWYILASPIVAGAVAGLLLQLLTATHLFLAMWSSSYIFVLINIITFYASTRDVVGYEWAIAVGIVSQLLFQVAFWGVIWLASEKSIEAGPMLLSIIGGIVIAVIAERLSQAQRYYNNLRRLTPRLDQDYAFAIRELRDGLKDIYSIKTDFLSKAIINGLKTTDSQAIGRLLKDLTYVVGSIQKSERVGWGVDHHRALFEAHFLLRGTRNDLRRVSDRLVRRILKILVSQWITKVENTIKLSSREPNLEVQITTSQIVVSSRELLELELLNTGNGAARAVLVMLLIEAGSITVEGRDSIREYLLSPGESFSGSFEIMAHRKGRLKFWLEVSYVNDEGIAKKLKLERHLEAVKQQTQPRFSKVYNPYEFGKPIKDEEMFFGRHDILTRIDEELSNASGPTQPIALWGQRRIGKTSILYQVQRRSKDSYIPCLIDVQKVNPRKPAVLFRAIFKEIHKAYRTVIGTNPPTAEVLVGKPKPTEEFEAFDSDLIKLDQHLKESKERPILLIVDEVEALRKFDEGVSDMFGFFRSLIQETERILFLVAGSTGLFDLAGDMTSPFYNLFSTVECRELNKDEARQLVSQPCQKVGIIFTEERLIERVVELAGSNPYLIQGLCHYLIRRVNKQRYNTVSPADLQAVTDAFVSEQAAYFKYFWDKTSALGKLALYVSAQEGGSRTEAELFRLMKEKPEFMVRRGPLAKELKALDSARILRSTDSRGLRTQSYWFSNALFPKWILRSQDASLKSIGRQFEIEAETALEGSKDGPESN